MNIVPGINYDAVVLERVYRGAKYVLTIGDKFRYFERIGYAPYSWKESGQLEFHACPARFRVEYGASRTGKSMMAARDVQPIIAMPGTRGWIVAPTYTLGEKEFRYVWTDMITNLRIETREKHYNKRGGQMDFTTALGSEIWVKSSKEPTSLLGEALDWVILSECAQMSPVVWERYIQERLGDRLGMAIFPTTPKGMNWVYDKWELGHDKSQSAWWGNPEPLPYYANPYLPIEPFNQAKKDLDYYTFAEQYLGLPVYFTGRCYKTFEPEIHVIPTFDIPKEWKRYRGIDPGCAGFFGCIWLAVDFEGNYIIYNDFLSHQTPTSLHIAGIKERSRDEYYEFTVSDPAATQVIEDFIDGGIMCVRAAKREFKDWKLARVNRIEPLLRADWTKENPFTGKKPASHLYVQEHCKDTIHSFINNRWAEQTKEGSVMQEVKDKFSHLANAWEFIGWTTPEAPAGQPKEKTIEELKKEERDAVWDRLKDKAAGRGRNIDEHLGDM